MQGPCRGPAQAEGRGRRPTSHPFWPNLMHQVPSTAVPNSPTLSSLEQCNKQRNQFSYSSGGQKSKGCAGPVPPEGSWPFPGLLQLLQPPECFGLGALPALLTFLTLRTPGLRQTHLDNPGSLAHLSSLNLLTDATSLPPCAVSWPQDLGRGCGHLLGPWFGRHTWLRPQSPSYLGGQRWPACRHSIVAPALPGVQTLPGAWSQRKLFSCLLCILHFLQ